MSILIRTVPIIPPSLNQQRGQHWSVAKREVDQWKLLIPQAHGDDVHHKGDAKRLVEIVMRKQRGPLGDYDGRYGRVKPVLDALVHRGWIWDDRPAAIDLLVREETGCDETMTVIAVSDAAEERAAAA